MQQDKIAVLDLDGVILKTNLIKCRAMLSLFAEYPDQREQISDYILARGGVPRRDKLAGILREIVAVEPTPPLIAGYLARYAQALAHELAIAPMVEGVATFLQKEGYTFYICSSAPEAEVHCQLERRNLLGYFTKVYGSTTAKADALRSIRAVHSGSPLVFFGDAVGDWEAAQAADVAFVAVINELDNFGNQPVTKLHSFANLTEIERCIRYTLRNKS
ncbi:MAG: HAD hydrolase-like protein [Caldilineaceae bacterium]